MTKVKPYHTSGKDDYGTPLPLYDLLNAEFGFTLDVCANDDNHKCEAWISEGINALEIDWWGRVFMNPPFTKLDKFLAKMIKELVEGRIEMGVALVAARSDTQAMFTASTYAGEIRFLKGRVSYEVHPTPKQREQAGGMSEVGIHPEAWPGIVKAIGLPKTAILALMVDPDLPGGSEKLSIGAPFPSTVMIFDRRPTQKTVFWNWKHQVKTVYKWGVEGKGLELKTKSGGTVIVKPQQVMALAGSKAGKATSIKDIAMQYLAQKQQADKEKAEAKQALVLAQAAQAEAITNLLGPNWGSKTVIPLSAAEVKQAMLEAFAKLPGDTPIPPSGFTLELPEWAIEKIEQKMKGPKPTALNIGGPTDGEDEAGQG